MHAILPTAHGKRGRQTTGIISLLLLAATVVLGGISLWGPTAPGCIDPRFALVDRIYRFFLLFSFGGEGLKVRECFTNPLMEVARFTGPLGLFAGFLALLWGLLEDAVAWARRFFLARHAVVVGLGQRGRVLTRQAARLRRVVAIDIAAPEAVLPQRCEALTGDGREPRTLRKAHIDRAQFVFATTGDDLLNLQIARKAHELGCREVYALVSDAFARRVVDNAEFASINAVSLEEIAARNLAAEARFHELAELQGHAQAHLVLFGDGPLAGAIVAQAVRTALTSRLGTPVVTVLAAFPEQARKELIRSYPGLERACDFAAFEFDPPCDVLDQPELFARVAARGPVSAVVVVDPEPHRACLFAGALRGALRRASAWPAPIFFSAAPLEAAGPFAQRLDETPRLSDVLHPFESGARLCTPENVAEIDEAARRMHAAYLDAHRKLSRGAAPPSGAQAALTSWEDLAPTYRQANRRAADHVGAKLLSAGCFVPGGPLERAADIDLLADGRLERLADVEHRAWMADRTLAGWRPGAKRNERARIHECLVPYAELPEPTKDLDRAQIRDLVNDGLPRGGPSTSSDKRLTRLDLWFGVIGTLDIEERDVDWMGQAAVAQLDEVLARSPGRHVTFVSPLAPGADLIVTRRLLAHAAERGWPHRLIVPEALAPASMIADFEDRWRKGALGDVQTYAATWPEVATALLASREALIAGAPNARVVEAGVDIPAHTDAYRWQNAYIVRCCDVLLAATRSLAGRGAGGTAEALRWRAEPALIPAGLSSIPERPMDEAPRTVVINLKTREVG